MKGINRTILLFGAMLFLVFSSCEKETAEEYVIERGTVTDIDGNQYATVKIGDKWWMAENLRVTRFNDGTSLNFIELENTDSLWANADMASYTYINDTISGHLYNGMVLISGRNIAPEGWHVASDADWKNLEQAIGMNQTEAGQTGWRGTNEAEKLASKYSAGWPEGGELFGSDAFGFNAIPGGCRIFDGRTNITGATAFWWTSDLFGEECWYRYIDQQEKRIFRQHTQRQYGMSIRCVKD